MLTLRHMLRAAQLMQTYGDLRPGFLEHEAASLAGPCRSRSRPPSQWHPGATNEASSVVEVEYGRDPTTGEYGFTVK
jgi:hypothetical protein